MESYDNLTLARQKNVEQAARQPWDEYIVITLNKHQNNIHISYFKSPCNRTTKANAFVSIKMIQILSWGIRATIFVYMLLENPIQLQLYVLNSDWECLSLCQASEFPFDLQIQWQNNLLFFSWYFQNTWASIQCKGELGTQG